MQALSLGHGMVAYCKQCRQETKVDNMKYGIEVEGRFKGLKTLFMSAPEMMACTVERILGYAEERKVQQIYISDLEGLVLKQNRTLKALAKDYIVTLEVSSVQAEVPAYVNIMLNLKCETPMQFLKEGDQIKISQDQNVWAISVENMIRTVPEDFHGDVSFEYAGDEQ